MTSVLLALWYAAQGAYALPLPPFVKIDGPSPCNDLEVCRSISDIVWSCLGTILACTWVAIHPNIAAPSENFMARRAKIFVVALIAPELIVLWAFRQRLAARRLTRKFKEFGWTTTHSFFALMGGFTVSTDTQPLSTLDPDALEPYLRNHDIDVTEEEIWDKSKGDALAKSLVVLQVVWFILQLLARAIEKLPIAELELVTLGFAILNLVVHFCWWNKPLDVRCPVKVQVGSTNPLASMSLLYLSGLEGIPGSIHLNDTKSHASVIQFTPIDHVETGKGNKIVEIPEGIDESIPCSSIVSISDSGNSSKDNDTDSGIAPAISNSLQTMKPAPNRDGGGSHLDSVDSIGFHHTTISPNINLGVSGNGGGQIEGVIRTGVLDYCPLVRRIRRRDRALRDLPILNVPAAKQHIKTGQPSRISIHGGIFSRLSTWMKAILVLKSVPEMILLEFVRLVKLSGDSEDGPSHGVPSAYYHGRLYDKEQLAAYVLATGTATIFGAIHCIAWSFQFPSDGEKVPWRLSSLAMTFFPIFGSVICRFESFFMRRGRVARSLYSFLFWTSIISYMSARLTLLVQMLLLLRAPDAGIYRAVRWTTFIPHF